MAVLLQLCPFSDYLQGALAGRGEVVRWFALAPDEQDRFLADLGDEVRAVVTGGHLGCGNALMDRLPALGLVAINGVGFDKVDLDHARARGVRVTTTPGALTDDVADLAVGLLIGLLRQLPAADAYVRAGRWSGGDMPLARKVTGRRFGIVGLGQIGAAVAARLAPFGPVAYTDPIRKDVPYAWCPDVATLAREVDVLVVASSANAATRHLIGAEALAALGPDGHLVNVARGSIVDEQALIEALVDGRLAGAALDVYADEPNVPEALVTSERTVLAPHVASATHETRTRMADIVLENIDAFLAGRPLSTALA